MRINYENGSITSDDVLKHLCFTGQVLEVVQDVLSRHLARNEAEDRGIAVEDAQVQEFADAFRKQNGLHSADDTHGFLEYFGLSVDDFSNYCESSIMMNEAREEIADEDAVQEYFINNRSRFDRARLYVIVVDQEPLANEIQMQLTEEDADFHDLARRYSIDESTKYAGGYLGEQSRNELTEGLSAKVFNADDGEILGPVGSDGVFQIYRVDEVLPAELDDELTYHIRNLLFERWLNEQIGDELEFEPD